MEFVATVAELRKYLCNKFEQNLTVS